MEYMQEDPYSSHRFAPHDPYYSGGGGGGGGYGGNTSFDQHSEHSIHSDRNRPVKNYNEMPNGGPYGSSSNLHPEMMRASPQPPREDPYSGSFHDDPPQSGNYNDPYRGRDFPDEDPRYGGGGGDPYNLESQQLDPYGQDGSFYNQGPPQGDYSFQGAPPQQQHPQGPGGEGPSFHEDDRVPYYDEGAQYNEDPRYGEQQGYPQDFQDYRDAHNRSNGPLDDPYNNSVQGQPRGPDGSFHDPRHDSFQGPPGSYDPNQVPQQFDQDPYNDQDRYLDDPRNRHSLDQQPGSGVYQGSNYGDPLPPVHLNESVRDDRNLGGDDHQGMVPQGRYEGLPPVRDDPFADDPFREQNSRDVGQISQGEDPYYRGPSPSGGPDPGLYDDQGPGYSGPPYDERTVPDSYLQGAPKYNQDYPDNSYPPNQGEPEEGPYYPESDPTRRLGQLTLGPPPDMRGTPSIDGRGNAFMARNPDLQEVIDFLNSDDHSVQASAAAYLQHLTYMDDDMKAKTRSMGGIRPLIRLLSHELVEVHKNACGALQNLSYGRANIDNKRAIKNENGIPELIRLLRKTDQEDVKESVTGVLWNLSSCEDLKQPIIEDGLTVLVNSVLLKYSGWNSPGSSNSNLPWTTVCRNTTGVLRNVSSAGFDARKRLRECRGLVNSLIHILKLAAEDVSSNDIDNKPVENTVCILRNLSYRIQEVVDPDFFKKRTLPRQQTHTSDGKGGKSGKGEGPGCFGNKSQKAKNAQSKSTSQINSVPPELPPSSIEYRALWGPAIHTLYSTVLKRCTNPITMEASAGAIQNLTACDWQPAVESRATVRKEKGLPLLVDLLSAESNRVVCATATALRNLAIDEKNRDLIGSYAMHQLVSRLPRDNRNNLPDDTICAVVATLYEVVKEKQDFAYELVREDGLPRLMYINNSEGRFLARTLKFTLTLLKTLWGFKSLHTEYAKFGYGQADFTTSKAYARQDGSRPPDMMRTPTSSNHTTPYNTLSRPMSGQGYDDSTLTPARSQQQHAGGGGGYYGDQRGPSKLDGSQGVARSNASLHDNSRDRMNYSRDRIQQDEIPMSDMGPGYAPLDEPRPHRVKPPVGGVPLFPNLGPAEPPVSSYDGEMQPGTEPLYARVNKSGRRRNDPYNDAVVLNSGSPAAMHHSMDSGEGVGGADSWV